MKPKTLFRRMAVLVATMMCALSANAAEAYACYTPSNTTLTFYYDTQRSSRSGTTYDMSTGSSHPRWYFDGTNANVTKVVFDPSFANARPTITTGWFDSMQRLQSITGMEYLNTSEVTDMSSMFFYCNKLTSLDLTHFETSKVTHMINMFYGCTTLVTIYVDDGWNVDRVLYGGDMFGLCSKLVGGKGTTYDSNHVDETYAHDDGGPSNPGYLTNPNVLQAYACYTPGNTTLTFYYDKQRNARTGTTYDLNTGNYSPGWYTDGINANVTKVVFNSSFAEALPTTCHSWFRDMAQLQTIYGLNYLNTSAVTHMVSMFRGCSSLTVLDLSSFNTANVIAMGGMFMHCSNLRTIYVGSGWSTAAVEASAGMFSNCTSLVGGQGTTYDSSHTNATYAHIDGGPSNPGYFTDANGTEAYAVYTTDNKTLTFYCDGLRNARTGTTYDLNTGMNNPYWESGVYTNVTHVVFDPSFAKARPTTTCKWFYQMQKLESITGMEYLNTSEVTNMVQMFYCCYALTSLDVSHFNTSKVTSMNWMFNGCTNVTSLNLSSFNTSKVTNMANMFDYCYKVQRIYVGDGWNTASVTSTGSMFRYCRDLVGGMGTTFDENHIDISYAHIDGGPSDPGYFSSPGDPYAVYTPDNSTLTFYCDAQNGTHPGTTYDLGNIPGWNYDGTCVNVLRVVFDPTFATARPTTTAYWFAGMNYLRSITGIEYLNTSEVTNMFYMFSGCIKLASLDVSGFNTAKVTDMGYMFRDCKSLKSLDVSNFNTAKVTSMSDMFQDCDGLTSLDLSNFNTAKVTIMSNMFWGCEALTSLDVSSFNTANVTDMSLMFSACNKLASLDVSSFNTAKVTNMRRMFEACSELTSLDLSGFNTSKVTSMNWMFHNSFRLKTIYVGDGWSTAAVTSSDDMFYNCRALVGGQGTTWNESNPKDKTYAHIDGGPSNPGYFTEWKEAYACYTPSNTTLTFYYDNYRSSRTGTTYDLNTGSTDVAWDTDGTNASVTKVVFDPSFAGARPTTTYDWFYDMTNLQSITGLSYLNTSEVTKMGHMFNSCYRLTSLDLSGFSTSRVTTMNCMFFDCRNLQTIYVGTGWSTAAVTNSDNMFSYCTSLVGGQGTTWNESNPKDATYAHIDGGASNPGYFTEAATGVATNVEVVPAKTTTVKGIYTLDGRKLNELPTQKGVYIIDGRRVVIK